MCNVSGKKYTCYILVKKNILAPLARKIFIIIVEVLLKKLLQS